MCTSHSRSGPSAGRSETVSLIVLNWNGERCLLDCIASLTAVDYPSREIILVDNGSTDDSVQRVAAAFPHVNIIEIGRNLGYAGGMNIGLASATGDVIVLLNNDVIVPPNWLQELVAGMESDQRIGIAGCKLFFADGVTIQHAGGYVKHPLGTTGHFGYGQRDDGRLNVQTDVDYVTGAAMAIRRAALDEIGTLDRGYWFYYEDVDLCYRARRKGWRVVYVPKASLIHLESATMVRDSTGYLRNLHRGRIRFALKAMPARRFVEEFVPAELAWLEHGATQPEHRVLASAYMLGILAVPSLAMAEGSDGTEADGIHLLISGLSTLWERTRLLRVWI